jgi:hypothetical protein
MRRKGLTKGTVQALVSGNGRGTLEDGARAAANEGGHKSLSPAFIAWQGWSTGTDAR